jgi:hypothetical protein
VVFVGSANLRDGPKLHTRWSYIAWHLAGEAGLEPIAEGNSASELTVEVFKLAGPSVILLDELVMFTRQLPDERFFSAHLRGGWNCCFGHVLVKTCSFSGDHYTPFCSWRGIVIIGK